MKTVAFLFLLFFVPENELPASLTSLDWLAGYWTATIDDTRMEEFWLHESGGVMLGLHRDTRPSKRAFFEYLRIVAHEDGISYFASPNGREATEFRLWEWTENKVVFSNPDHDYPQEIIYELQDSTHLIVRIEGVTGGEKTSLEWRWTKTGTVK